MSRSGTVLVSAAALAFCAGALAQSPKRPIAVSDQYLATVNAKMKYSRMNKMSSDAKSAVTLQQPRIVSVPNWSGSFTTAGVQYPYTMVGASPRNGGTTTVPTSLIPISLFFDGYVDSAGNNITIDVTPVLNRTLHSPNFQTSSYETGYTQFGDAVQRAEFWNVMEDGWHTQLAQPRILTPVQVEVPSNAALLFETSSGTLFALIDVNFFASQLNTIVQLEGLKETELALAMTRGVFLYDNYDPTQCCILGFHTAYETHVTGNTHFVQTFAWANWVDPLIYSDPSVADVLPLSHEISEWLNDPFINNVTPSWQFPDGSGACQGDLETGDPIEVLANSGFPVALNGFLFHPQNEALLQWFSRVTPSTAYKGAYSFPNRSLLSKASVACAH